MMKLTFSHEQRQVFEPPGVAATGSGSLLLGQGRRTKHVALQNAHFFIFVPLC